MTFGRYIQLGTAEARVVIDLSQPQASVAQMRQIAEQIRASLNQVNQAMQSSSKSSTIGLDAAAYKLQTAQLKTASAERIALLKLETENFKIASAERIAVMKHEADMQKLAYKQQRDAQRDAQRQQSQEQGSVKSTVDAALKGVEAWAAAQRKRHDEQIAYLRQEAEAFDRMRSAALKQPSMDMTQPMSVRQMSENTRMNLPRLTASDDWTQQNDNITQLITSQATQAVGALQDLTQPFVASVTQTFQPVKTAVTNQVRQIGAYLAQARAEIANQSNLFRQAAATAPNTVARAPVQEALQGSKAQVSALNQEFARLKSQIAAAAGDPVALRSLEQEMNRLLAAAERLAQQGFPGAARAVTEFSNKALAARSGLQGYFTAVREGLEQLNERSLAANLQEISFRLLPVGLATGAALKQGIDTAQGIEVARVNLEAFTGSQEQAITLMNSLTEGARRLGQPMFEVLDVMTQFAPQLREAGISLEDAFNLASRLAAANPREGLQGALYSLSEAAAGQFVSLRRRFNVSMETLQPMIDSKGLVAGLDEYLAKLGRTSELAAQLGQTSRGAFVRLSDAWSEFLAGSVQSYLDGMTGAANVTADFLHTLAQSDTVLKPIIGGFLNLSTSISTALLSLGQFALYFKALEALTLPILKRIAAGFLETAAGARIASAASAITSSYEFAKVGGAAAATGTVAITTAAALLIGSIIGQIIASKLEESGLVQEGFSDPSALWTSFKQAIFVGITGIGAAFFIGAELIGSGIGAIVDAIDLMATAIMAGVNNLREAIGGILLQLGSIKIGRTTFVNEEMLDEGLRLQNEAESSRHSRVVIRDAYGNQTGEWQVPGERMGGYQDTQAQENTRRQAEDAARLGTQGYSYEFIEGYTERIERLNDALKNPPNPDDIVTKGIERLNEFVQNTVMPVLFPELMPQPTTEGGTGTPSGSAGANNADLIDQIYSAALNHMIETTRTLEDQALAAAREAEDWALQQARAYDDFNRQMQQAEDDFYRQRAQAQEDFDRQAAEQEEEVRKQQQKQQEDFNKQMIRAEEDHVRNMKRMARDVDDAISARDFLSAQKQIQKMNDEQEDFDIEQKRRREDFAEQIDELEENLREQQQKRREDFARQQRLQLENFQLQQRRQVENFQRQQQREEEDRQRRLARQEQDYAIAYQRREQDYALQLLQLQNHNGLVRFYWQYGLGSLQSDLLDFFRNLGVMGFGDAVPPTIPDQNHGSQPFATGVWRVPYDMMARIHKDEIITPAPFAESVRRGDAVISGRRQDGGGDNYYVTLQFDTSNIQDVDALVDAVEDRVVPKLTEEMERINRNRRRTD